MRSDPLIITGKGGSGTRVLAFVLQALGYDFGKKLNEAAEHPRLAKLLNGSDFLFRALKGDTEGAAAQLRLALNEIDIPADGRWGIKLPMLSVTVPVLRLVVPDFQMILVVRDGRDMLSAAQNKRRDAIMKAAGLPAGPPNATFWSWCNLKALDDLGRSGSRARKGAKLYVSRYESLCLDPFEEIRRVLHLIDLDCTKLEIEAAARLVKPSEGMMRWKDYPERVKRARSVLEPAMGRLGYQWS